MYKHHAYTMSTTHCNAPKQKNVIPNRRNKIKGKNSFSGGQVNLGQVLWQPIPSPNCSTIQTQRMGAYSRIGTLPAPSSTSTTPPPLPTTPFPSLAPPTLQKLPREKEQIGLKRRWIDEVLHIGRRSAFLPHPFCCCPNIWETLGKLNHLSYLG